MALNIPTTAAQTATNLANFESEIGQNAPANEKAWMRVESAVQALMFTTLYKYGAHRALQNLALTAGEDGLEIIGNNYGVPRNQAEAFQCEGTLPGTNGTTIPVSVTFIGDSNKAIYTPDAQVVIAGGVADLDITAAVLGEAGNLIVGDTMTMTSQIAGATNEVTITTITNQGVEREDLETYRRRVLAEIRTVGGGSNKADYRRWAELDSNIERAYPYAGIPIDITVPFYDGDAELSGTAYWLVGNSATLSKSAASPHTGSNALRVAHNGVANPYAYQAALTIGQRYLVTGWARGDATYYPTVQNQHGVNLWRGTTAVSWQAFDIMFVATGTEILFGGNQAAAGWVEFDDIEITIIDLPGQRTVYIEADSAVNADGLSPAWLLDDGRDAINEDSDGVTQPALGTIDGDLYVEPIIRSIFDVTIRNLVISSDIEVQIKADISSALTAYFLSVEPFITGLDFEGDRNNVITQLSLSEVVQDILKANGGYADTISFQKTGEPFTSSYTLGENEKAKLGTITYS